MNRTKITPALRGEHGRHKTTTRPCRGKFGRDDRAERVISTDTDAHDETPNNENTNNVDRRALARQSLSECSDDDDHELNAICKNMFIRQTKGR